MNICNHCNQSEIIYPHVVPNLYYFHSSKNHKKFHLVIQLNLDILMNVTDSVFDSETSSLYLL